VKLADIDWTVLRGAFALLLVSVVLSGGVLGGSYYFWSKMDREYRRQNSKLLSIRRRYQSIDDEERAIQTYLPRFRQLEEGGVIGREQRLNWIEKLREVSQALKLPSVQYSIDTQVPYKPEFPVPEMTSFRIYASRMTVSLGLLHEEDLPRLLAELGRAATGLYSVSKCSIRRNGMAFARSPTTPNLTAECELQWMTVRTPATETS